MGYHEADFGWGIELARALTAALSKFANEILITAADNVGFNVIETEPLGADGLDEVAQAGVVNVALAVGGGVEVDAVDNAFEQRIGVGDSAEVGRELLADLVGEGTNDGPDGVVGILRLQREEKADEFLVVLDELERLVREPTSWAMRLISSSKTSHRRLVKMSGRMNSLYFGASLAPRMEQAASQIQDSRDLSVRPDMSDSLLYGPLCITLELRRAAGVDWTRELPIAAIVLPFQGPVKLLQYRPLPYTYWVALASLMTATNNAPTTHMLSTIVRFRLDFLFCR